MHAKRVMWVVAVAACATVGLGLGAEAYGAAKVTAVVRRKKLIVTGTAAGQTIALRQRVRRLVVDVGNNGSADFSFRLRSFRSVVVNAGGGNDSLKIDEKKDAFTKKKPVTLNGQGGSDSLVGGSFADRLNGGAGNDSADGNGGSDRLSLGDGGDSLVWNPGDGNDVVEGGSDQDSLTFNGSTGVDSFGVSPQGDRARVTRSGIGVSMDDVESATLNAREGSDATAVGNLASTSLGSVHLELGVAGVADAGGDSTTIAGTEASDGIAVATTSPSAVQVAGLATTIDISNPAIPDSLRINGLGGNDDVSTTGNLAALVNLTQDGGAGNDTLTGANGPDLLLGGADTDILDGNAGQDIVLAGTGGDLMLWNPGDGSDVLEGQGDLDSLNFNGSAGGEIMTLSANGGRAVLTRNVGNITMDIDDVEALQVNALGGSDSVTVNDLAATDVNEVFVDLGLSSSGDGAADAVTLNGTAASDLLSISGGIGNVEVISQALTLVLTRAEAANDTLTVNGLAGADQMNASALANSSIVLVLNGGTGDDILVGSLGNDTINGDAGDDVLRGDDGNDTLNGGADTDVIDGGAGTDSQSNGETVTNVP